ncbi:MAG: CrcB family protein [Flavobacteriaceae bacterium]|nr:CrcB family protein [Flavobacteriaceae bacterium]MDZ4149290.1 CrcB family protein [Flavobacteriaceae bacterium]
MKNFFLIFVGGGMGSVFRYALGRWLNTGAILPWGTFLANILGSFLIGVIIGYASRNENQLLTFLLAVGFCGGFTTFSGFAFENMQFLISKNLFSFFLYTFLTLLFCISSVYGGILTSKLF